MWGKITAFFMSIIAFFMGLFGINVNKPVEKPETLKFTDTLLQYMPEDKNYMFSPLSVSIAFGMLANGANGETLKQIQSVFGFEDLDAYNKYVKSLIEKYSKADFLALNISDSIWLNTDNAGAITFNNSFKNTLKTYYDAQSSFVTNADAVNKINSWVNDKTNGRIPTIVSNSDFMCCLLNALYFKAAWQTPFPESATRKDIFTSRDKSKEFVNFMHYEGKYNYYESADGTQMVELPYINTATDHNSGRISESYSDLDLSMYLILSDGDVYPEYLIDNASFSSETVRLSIPKFKTEFSTQLKDILIQMGMTDAFDGNKADFSGAFDNLGVQNAYVSSVIQKTFISVDEKGTEAAAVTSISMNTTSIAPIPKTYVFDADHPFTYVIRDNNNGEILFVGEYAFAE